jgi:O-antigen/teichoic acid export membrane protein
MKNLRERLISSGSWSLLGNAAAQVLRFGSNLILTKLLMPEAFGLMAIVSTIHVGVVMLSDAGLTQSLITNHKGEDALFRGTAWTIQVVRGFILGAVIVASAGLLVIAQIHGWVDVNSTLAHPTLPLLLTAYGLLPVLQGFTSTKVAMAQRRLENKWPTICGLIAQLLVFPVTVLAAYQLRSVWALFIGAATGALLNTVLTHLWIPGQKDRLAWHPPYAVELAKFGRWIMLASCIGFLASNGDRLVLSTLIDAHLLGQYTIAMLICSIVQTIYSMGMSALVLPALANSRGNGTGPSATMYRKMQLGADVFLLGSAGLLAFAAGPIIDLLYGPKFEMAGQVLFVLALGMSGMRLQVLEQYFMAANQPRFMSFSNVARSLVLLVGGPLAFHQFGFMGCMVAVSASQFAGWPILTYQRRKQGLGTWRDDLKALAILCFFSLLGCVLSLLIKALLHQVRP